MIIEKAAPIFMIRGIAGTAMSDIMEATGLSKGTLYIHFKNKEELVNHVIDHNMGMLGQKVTEAMAQKITAHEKLLAYLNVFKDTLQPPVPGGCPMINFGMEVDDTDPLLKSKIAEAVEYSQQLITDLIDKGINEGEFKKEWDAKEFGTVMFAMIEGGVMISRIIGNNQKMQVITNRLELMIAENLN